MQTRIHAPVTNLEHGWIIDSGASTHMTPVKRDCKNIYTTLRQVYMADGSSVVCREAGDISIPLKTKNGSNYNLMLKDVLIIPNLDRRLFSVNAFLRRGNNWVRFYQYHVELGIKSGPTIKIPNSSLQSSAMVVLDQGPSQNRPTKRKKNNR